MPFYELEIMLDELKILSEEEENERKKQEKGQHSQVPNLNINSQMSSMQRGIASSLPSLPNFKL